MRLSRLAFVLVVVALLAAGCAQPAPAAAPTAAPAAPAEPTEAPKPTEPSAVAEPFRIALVAPSAKNDLAFTQSMYDALVSIQEEMGKDNFEFVYSENMFAVADAAAAIRDYASQGYNLVIAHGSQYGSSLAEIAPDFPDTAFAWGTSVDTFESEGIKNVSAYTVLSDQGGYVEGVMAAMLSKSNVIGVVGPISAGDGKRTVEGFEAGVKATTPDADVQVIYTGSFSDVALASQAAQTLINSDADVLTGTGQMVVGAISVAKDAGVLWFGNQASQTSLAPAIVVANQIYDWAGPVKQIIADAQEGTLGGKVYTLTLENGGIRMEYNSDYDLPAEVKAAAEEAIAGISDGSIVTGVE